MELMERWNQKKELAVTTSYAMYLNIKSLCAVAKTTDLKGECECVCVCVCVCVCGKSARVCFVSVYAVAHKPLNSMYVNVYVCVCVHLHVYVC